MRSGAQAEDAEIPRVYKEICWQRQTSNPYLRFWRAGALAIELHSFRHFAFCIKAAALASRRPAAINVRPRHLLRWDPRV